MRTSFLLFFILIGFTCLSQEKFYAYRSDWSNTTDMKEAKYIMHVKKEDTSFVCRYYYLTGPMIRMESFSDESLTIPMGRFAWYNINGRLDSTGLVYEGRKHKTWMYITHPDSSSITLSEYYDNGILQERTDHINRKKTYTDGSVVHFDSIKSDSPAVTVQVEASFPKGLAGWKKYLEKNLKTPDRFMDIVNDNGRATIVVAFMVDTDGSIADAFLWNSFEWSVDMEALRVIQTGPKWEPATQNGRKVKYRQKQSITFIVRGG